MSAILRILLILLIKATLIYAGNPDKQPSTFVFPAFKHSYGIRKAGPTELFLFFGFKVRFDDPQGLACVRLDVWDDPDDSHDDDELTVYGVNSGENDIIYNKSMWSLGVYGIDEKDNQKLKEPHGISARSNGDVYVADSGNHRIVRLFNPGHELQYVSSFGTRGTAAGEFEYPCQVALDNSGNAYVTDTGNNRIQVFDSTDTYVYDFSHSGMLLNPQIIAVVGLKEKYRNRPREFIIVVDSMNCRIHRFSLQGKWQKTVRMKEFGFDSAHLEYACLDYYDQLLVTDSQNHCIHKFTNDLQYITSFGEKGDDDNQFIEPRGITIYRRFGQLFVAEKKGAQYYWIGTDVLNLRFAQNDSYIEFNFFLTEPSYITADITDQSGGLINTIADQRPLLRTGPQKMYWNGTKRQYGESYLKQRERTISKIVTKKNRVPAGKYLLELSVEATYSSRTYFQKHIIYPFTYRPR
jgi:hypothetical protein